MGAFKDFIHEVNRGFVHSITGGLLGQSTRTGEVGWLESGSNLGRRRSSSVVYGPRGSGHAPSDWHGHTQGSAGRWLGARYEDRYQAWPGSEGPGWQDPGGSGRVENPDPNPGYRS